MGKDGEAEKKTSLCTKEHVNLNIPVTDKCSTQASKKSPALYLSHCTRCHTTCCTAKADLVMLHPGQTFLSLLLASLSVHTLLIFYHECWLLLVLNLFDTNLVFS